jgi:hypothetical protein
VTVCRWELSEATGVTDAGFTEYLVVGGEGDGFGLIAACPMRDDARLIAAAPDLYEALDNAARALAYVIEAGPAGFDADELGGLRCYLDQVRKALAKAEGQS